MDRRDEKTTYNYPQHAEVYQENNEYKIVI